MWRLVYGRLHGSIQSLCGGLYWVATQNNCLSDLFCNPTRDNPGTDHGFGLHSGEIFNYLDS